MTVAQRLGGGLNDMLRRAKVRLADAQIDDVAAGSRQGGGAGQHGKGVFLANTVKIRDGLHAA
jgi:hypothetical protein